MIAGEIASIRMAHIVLGGKQFDPECEEIEAWNCGVSDAEVAALGKRMAAGEFGKVRLVYLVSCAAFIVHAVACCWAMGDSGKSLFLLVTRARGVQYDNRVGDDGACLLGQALTFSSSVHTLHLVSCASVVVSSDCH